MDGNGRWARQRGLPRVEGHRAGIRAVRETVEAAARLELEALTLYAFSTENWKRPRWEVRTLMALLKEYLAKELRTMVDNNIRFRPIGRLGELEPEIQDGPRARRRGHRAPTPASPSRSRSTTPAAPSWWTWCAARSPRRSAGDDRRRERSTRSGSARTSPPPASPTPTC